MTEEKALKLAFEQYNRLLCAETTKTEYSEGMVLPKQRKRIEKLLENPAKIHFAPLWRFVSYSTAVACALLIISFCLPATRLHIMKLPFLNPVSDGLYNYEVTVEPFESMESAPSYSTHKTYSSEQELFDASEMVFIGMPLETFTDGTERYYNYELEEIEKDSGEKAFFYCTVRDIKVIEMIKGDSALETVAVAEEAVIEKREGGSDVIIGMSSTQIAKKNVKYVYYLRKTADGKSEFYIAPNDGGLINIDGLDPYKTANTERLLQVKERFAEQFEKYNRVDE